MPDFSDSEKSSGNETNGHQYRKSLHLDWSSLHQITQTPDKWREVVDRHAEVFKEELGQVQGVKAMVHVDPQAQPRFY